MGESHFSGGVGVVDEIEIEKARIGRIKAQPERGLESERNETASESVFCGSRPATVAASSESVRPPLVAIGLKSAAKMPKIQVHVCASSETL
jgi:hypothetical protein